MGQSSSLERLSLLGKSRVPEYGVFSGVAEKFIPQLESQAAEVNCKKPISLVYAVCLVVVSVAGSSVFISPTGVPDQVGSVGASMGVWITMGVLNLMLTLCYAELGSAFPRDSYDYGYANLLLGPLPSFLVLWASTIITGPCAAAVMARTVADYILFSFETSCHTFLSVIIAVFVNMAVMALGIISTTWPARLLTSLTVAKLAILTVIIVTGIIKLIEGNTNNLANPFYGSMAYPGGIVFGMLSGFVTYGGWRNINELAEEMKNPKRDLMLTAVISLILITGIYILVNLSFFSVLSPQEFMSSEAVVATWAQKALPGAVWVMQLGVILSALGSSLGTSIVMPEVAFTGGQDGNFPAILGCVHIKHTTPVPAIILFSLVSSLYTSMMFYDLQTLLEIVGSMYQIRQIITLAALLKLKMKHPNLPSSFQMPLVVVMGIQTCLVGMVGVAIYQAPLVKGVAALVFLMGIPLYYISLLPAKSTVFYRMHVGVTKSIQQLLLVAPLSHKT